MTMAAEFLSLAFKSLERAGNEGNIDHEDNTDTEKGKAIQETKFELPVKLDHLNRCLETITEDIKAADELLNHTIQMV